MNAAWGDLDGQRPEPVFLVGGPDGKLWPAYAVMVDGSVEPVHLWPRTAGGEGAMNAIHQATELSRHGVAHEVMRPDGRLIARFVLGRRADVARPDSEPGPSWAR